MRKLGLILLVIMTEEQVYCLLMREPDPNYEFQQLSKCIQVVSQQHFERNSKLLISVNAGELFTHVLLETLVKNLHSTVGQIMVLSHLNIGGDLLRDIQEKFDDFLFVVVTNLMAQSFEEQLDVIEHSRVWNSTGHFVVVALGNNEETDSVRYIVSELWKRFVINILVIHFKVNHSDVQIYTWFPFSRSGQCGKNTDDIVVIDEWDEGYFKMKADLFPRKVPDVLRNCTLTVTTVDMEPFLFASNSCVDPEAAHCYREGLDVSLLDTVAHWYGYKVRYRRPLTPHPKFGYWGGSLSNGTWLGGRGDLLYGRADVAIGSFRLIVDASLFLDVTEFYMRDPVLWHVPRARQIPHWKSPLIIFSNFSWFAIVSSWVTMSVVTLVVSRVLRERRFRSVVDSVISSYSIMIGVTIDSVPHSPTFRLLFATWICYCLFVSSAYQSVLIGILTDPGYEKQITTVKELVNSKLHYGGIPNFRHIFADGQDEVTRKLYDNYEVCNPWQSCLKRLIEEDDFCEFGNAIDTAYKTSGIYFSSSGKKVFIPLKDGGTTYDNVMWLRKSSPHTERFNSIFRKIKESGILSKWFSDLRRAKIFREISRSGYSSKRVVLDMTHLEGMFALLSVGLLISVVVFCVEIISSKRHDSNKKQKRGRVFRGKAAKCVYW